MARSRQEDFEAPRFMHSTDWSEVDSHNDLSNLSDANEMTD